MEFGSGHWKVLKVWWVKKVCVNVTGSQSLLLLTKRPQVAKPCYSWGVPHVRIKETPLCQRQSHLIRRGHAPRHLKTHSLSKEGGAGAGLVLRRELNSQKEIEQPGRDWLAQNLEKSGKSLGSKGSLMYIFCPKEARVLLKSLLLLIFVPNVCSPKQDRFC